MNLKFCPFCGGRTLYILEDDYRKCKDCTKKFSLKKYETDIDVINYFCNNINANTASIQLRLNYRTIQNRYTIFRKLIANYLDEQYHSQANDNTSFEEYYYFTTKFKNKKKRSLFDAINIIGFYSNKKIFTLLMPKLPKSENDSKNRDYEYYLRWHKLYSQNSYKTPLNIFWKYLEENLKKYKGVSEENFFLYLKEAEFKFNYLQNQQIEILKDLYYKY